jgi:hypothetical protein
MGVVVFMDGPTLGLLIWGPMGGSPKVHRSPWRDKVTRPIVVRFRLFLARFRSTT